MSKLKDKKLQDKIMVEGIKKQLPLLSTKHLMDLQDFISYIWLTRKETNDK